MTPISPNGGKCKAQQLKSSIIYQNIIFDLWDENPITDFNRNIYLITHGTRYVSKDCFEHVF